MVCTEYDLLCKNVCIDRVCGRKYVLHLYMLKIIDNIFFASMKNRVN